MFLSRRCEYAIRCALYVAAAGGGALVGVRETAEALGIPRPFLAKLVQALTFGGILRSQRGRGGGVALARPASEMTLKEIVLAVDGPRMFTECVLRLEGCGALAPCPLHEGWVPLRQRLDALFSAATLADIAASVGAGAFRLSSLTPGAFRPDDEEA